MVRLTELVDRLIGRGDPGRVAVAGFEYDPTDLTSRGDVPRVLGITEQEFVEAVLAANGGRMKQRGFTEVTDWSPSQVSKALSTLEADGAIVRRRVGNEKVVRLPRADDPSRGP